MLESHTGLVVSFVNHLIRARAPIRSFVSSFTVVRYLGQGDELEYTELRMSKSLG